MISVKLDCLGGNASRSGGAGMVTFPCGNEGQMRGGLLKVSRVAVCVFDSTTCISFLSLQDHSSTIQGDASVTFLAAPTPSPTHLFDILVWTCSAESPDTRCLNYPKGPWRYHISGSIDEFFDQSLWIRLWIKMGITGDKCWLTVDNWRKTCTMYPVTLIPCLR